MAEGHNAAANAAYGYAAYPGYTPPKPGDPVSIPGYPDGTYTFGGWSGPNAYYLHNASGRSVWDTELFGMRPDPKQLGAAIAAAATHRRSWEREQQQWQYYYQQQAEYAQMAYQTAPVSDVVTSTGWEAHANGSHAGHAQTDSNVTAERNVRTADEERQTKKARTDDSKPPSEQKGKISTVSRGLSVANGSAPLVARFGTVYVWDLDETLIVFNSLLTGAFMDARRPGAKVAGSAKGMSAENAKILSAMAEQIEDLVYAMAERSFFFKQLEGRNRRCFGEALSADDGRDLSAYDFASDGLHAWVSDEGQNRDAGTAPLEEERKVAWRYRVVRDLYVASRSGAAAGGAGSSLLAQEREAAEAATEAINVLADGWLSAAEEVLSSIWQYEAVLDRLPYTPLKEKDAEVVFKPDSAAGSSGSNPSAGGAGTRSDLNVLVTNGELLPTVAKLLLFGLAKHFHPSCIYSSRNAGKEVCFREVVQRFGAAEDMVAIGDGAEEEDAAKRCGMRFVKVACAQDLRRVRDLPA